MQFTSGIVVEEPEGGEFRELTDQEREGMDDSTTGPLSNRAGADAGEGDRDRDRDAGAGSE